MSYIANLKNNTQTNVLFCQSKEQPANKYSIFVNLKNNPQVQVYRMKLDVQSLQRQGLPESKSSLGCLIPLSRASKVQRPTNAFASVVDL